ncbi:hypothetical protein OAX78_02320 [Planctomycetota bacterium]|nr:hypothetical protein [Planctomycetota bacterium]
MRLDVELAREAGLEPAGPVRNRDVAARAFESLGPDTWSRCTGRTTATLLRALATAADHPDDTVIVLFPTLLQATNHRRRLDELLGTDRKPLASGVVLVGCLDHLEEVVRRHAGGFLFYDHSWHECASLEHRLAALRLEADWSALGLLAVG